MASFAEFLSTFDGDMNRRGKQFEHFVKWFLKNDPEWATQVEDVWLWDEYPGRWGPDCGIDLVFKSKIGKAWAVQAKCYSSDYDISKNDVDTFLSESNRKQIDHRLLIATTDRIGANARQVLDAQEKSVVRYLLSHFETAAVEFPNSIQSLSLGKRKPPPELNRPHQIEAVDAVLSGFQAASRGQVIMACGTGKTFVCLWVKERLKAKRTLVLVPSLGLLSQILNEWTFGAREPFDALCVCSDQTVNRRDEDEAIMEYKSHHDDCLVPQRFKDEGGFPLGVWVANQRRAFKTNTLSPDRIKQLNGIGLVWDTLADQWEKGFSHLKKFVDREGHCRVPKRYKANDDYRLGSWIVNQKSTKDKMDPDRRQHLEALPGWVWKIEK
jgi:Restriction endonuclease/Helicase associated domain/Type III restriction enzyme, res subunit